MEVCEQPTHFLRLLAQGNTDEKIDGERGPAHCFEVGAHEATDAGESGGSGLGGGDCLGGGAAQLGAWPTWNGQ